MDVHDTSALQAAIAADKAGTATEWDINLLLMSTDSAGQRILCAKYGREFPGAS